MGEGGKGHAVVGVVHQHLVACCGGLLTQVVVGKAAVVGLASAGCRNGNRNRIAIGHRQLAICGRYTVVARCTGCELVAYQLVRHGALIHIGDAARYLCADLVVAHKANHIVAASSDWR